LLGFNGLKFGFNKLMRVPDTSVTKLTIRGKVATKVARGTTGNVPFRVGAGFPHGPRFHLGQAEAHYSAQRLPDGAPTL
jgi:hypothetical protein